METTSTYSTSRASTLAVLIPSKATPNKLGQMWWNMHFPFNCNTVSIIKTHSETQQYFESLQLKSSFIGEHVGPHPPPPSPNPFMFSGSHTIAHECVLLYVCVCERETERTNLSLLPNHFTLHWGPSSFVNGLLVETRQAETLETWPQPLKGTALPFRSSSSSSTPFLYSPPGSALWIPQQNNWHTNNQTSPLSGQLGQLAWEVIPKIYTNRSN